jgi:regulator of replication initiation timing
VGGAGLRLRPTMTDDLRWAVRYAFLEDLWRDRPRVVVDAGLEAALRERPRARGAEGGPLEALIDALVPRVSKVRTWMAVADEAVARELAQIRPGAGFLPRSSFAEVVEHRDWEVALVELSALHDDAPGGTRLRQQLAERAQEGRTVIVSARSAPGQEDEDAGFAALSELLSDELGGGRIFGVYRPAIAAVIDFGEDEDESDAAGAGDGAAGEGEAGGEDDEVPVSFDNTLGSQTPAFVEYVALAGRVAALPEGMTLVELPANAPSVEQSSDGALRAQLVQAQRQAELAVIDRQALLEKVDALESAQARLEQQVVELRDHLARAVSEEPSPTVEAVDRLQAALADNQALRWKLQQLERELETVKARPVEALEAEVAALRAELAIYGEGEGALGDGDDAGVDEAASEEGAGASEDLAADAGDTDDTGDDTGDDAGDDAEAGDPVALAVGRGEWMLADSEAEDAAQRIRYRSALVDLDRLIARVERGGIGVLPLRQALVSLRKRLRG